MTSLNASSILPFLSAGCAALLLGACGGAQKEYPSLAVRDAERMVGELTPVQGEPAAPTYSVPAAKVDEALASARNAHIRFLAARPGAVTLVQQASGLGIGDDTHSRALIALADLTTLHSETSSALADLDRLEAQGATLFAPLDAVRAAQGEVESLVLAQNQTLDSLASELSQ